MPDEFLREKKMPDDGLYFIDQESVLLLTNATKKVLVIVMLLLFDSLR